MIICLPFFFSFLFSCKEFFILRSFVSLGLLNIGIRRLLLLVLIIFLYYKFFSLYNLKFIFFFFFVVFSLFFVSFTFTVCDIFYFFFFYESCMIPMVILISVFSKDHDKVSSFIFIFFLNIFGSIPFIFFCSLCNMGIYHFFEDFLCISNTNFLRLFFLFCFCLILLTKMPLFLFHFWLTKAHVSAFGACSMLLARIMLKLGSFGLLKFRRLVIFCRLNFISFFSSFCSLGFFLLSLFMIRFFDVKYLVACSSVTHLLYCFPFFLSRFKEGVLSSCLMLVGHGLVSYFLFFFLSLFYEVSQNRSLDFTKCLHVVTKRISFFFIFFLLCNMGIPPFMNFFREFFMFLFFFNFRWSICFLVGSGVLLFIVSTLFLTTKFLFGKKNLLTPSFNERAILLWSSIFSFFFFFILFLFCLFSLN